MKKNLAATLAFRYLFIPQKDRSLNNMIKVCVTAIALGSCALLLVLGIMTGFEEATHKQLQGIHSDLIMQSPTKQSLAYEKINEVLKKEFPEVVGIAPHATAHALVSDGVNTASSIVILQGIIPALEEQTTNLHKKIISPKGLPLSALLTDKNILLGEELAQELGVRPGDSIDLHFPHEKQHSRSTIKLSMLSARITGLFKTGVEDYDSSTIIANAQLLEDYFETGISSIGLKIKKSAHADNLKKRLGERFTLSVFSWQEMYKPLVAALKLEKYASGLILALIILIASMTIIAVLFMQITHKKKDIALLRAMGAPHSLIKQLFMYMGIIISGLGTSIGISIGLLISFCIKQFSLFPLPDAYYTSHLPIMITPPMIGFVALLVFAISLLATLFATNSIKHINILDVLKFDV